MEPQQQSKAQIRIAYADDHTMVRKGIAEYINGFEGCNVVVEAENGQQLLQELAARKDPLPDICILDIFMPELNGLQTLKELSQKWPSIKVLILTGHNTDYYFIQMIRAGASGYLQKNCSPKELEAAIRCIHQNGYYHSDILTSELYEGVKSGQIKPPKLTDNEISLLKYSCSDLSYDQIAHEMNTTMPSIDWCRSSLFKKLGVKSRSGLVMFAIRVGLVEQ